MAAKLTPWFPGDVKPARAGVYAVNTVLGDGHISYSHFDGRYWNGAWDTPKGAGSQRDFHSKFHYEGSCSELIRWRGLASNPKASQGAA